MRRGGARILLVASIAFVVGGAGIALLTIGGAPPIGAAAAAVLSVAALGAALAAVAAVAVVSNRRAERAARRYGRLVDLQRKLTAVISSRNGSAADQSLIELLKSELGCASVLLARSGAEGAMLVVDTETRSERKLAAGEIPAALAGAVASGRTAFLPGKIVVALVSEGRRIGALSLVRCTDPAVDAPLVESLRSFLSSELASQLHRQEQEYRKLKVIEEAYRLSEARLRAVFEESQDMLLTIDGDGRIIDINKAGARLLGYSVDSAVIGQREADFWVNGGDHAIFMEKISEQGWVKDFEVILKRRDGETVFGLESATLFRNRDGSIREIHATVKDITQRIRDEQSLWQMNIELAGANQKLRESQALMVQQEKLASIGQLAAGVAHEINNPLAFLKSNHAALRRGLTAIKEFVQSLAKTPEIEEGKKRWDIDYIVSDFDAVVGESDDGFRRITEIVQNLKNFARTDSTEKFALFDINRGIESTLAVARNEVKYVAEVKRDLGELPLVECRGGEINQVFLNILVNAAQAIKSQGRQGLGTIAITTSHRGDYVSIEISDDGPGIPKGIQMRIFDPFYTTKPVGQGTGLGLSISSEIVVTKHKGRLTVESEPGAGARFRIELPVKHPPDDPTPPPPPPLEPR